MCLKSKLGFLTSRAATREKRGDKQIEAATSLNLHIAFPNKYKKKKLHYSSNSTWLQWCFIKRKKEKEKTETEKKMKPTEHAHVRNKDAVIICK